METEISKQEIVLVTAAFARHSFCKRDQQRPHGTPMEQLEEACWDGLLDELAGDIITRSENGRRLSLSQVRPGKSLLGIELCNFPQAPERHLSIDPNLFVDELIWN